MTDHESATEAMPQTVEMYRHYQDAESFARDREILQTLGWEVESVRSLPPHRNFLNRLGRHDGRSAIDTHYLRPTWPDSWQ